MNGMRRGHIPRSPPPKPLHNDEPIAEGDGVVAATGAAIRHIGNRACFAPDHREEIAKLTLMIHGNELGVRDQFIVHCTNGKPDI